MIFYPQFRRVIRVVGVMLLACLLLESSNLPPNNKVERVRAYTRNLEFDFVAWTFNAIGIKLNQFALNNQRYLPESYRNKLVLNYLELMAQIQRGEARLKEIYADPTIADPQAASTRLRRQLDELYVRRQLEPLAEAILQDQLTEIVANLGLTLGGQPLPPILYHSTSLPSALIVSPRNAIWQDNDISLAPGLKVDQMVALENQIDEKLDVSSLVVDIGGIGLYPTMVMQTSDLSWLSEVVAHEWVHNFLTLRPLGINYETSPQLRIMNETTANIAGKEIGLAYLKRFYPELVPAPAPKSQNSAPASLKQAVFNYRAEMHLTRVTVDKLLAENKVEEAEKYMEERRVIFWEHGYHSLRKLNQAYFAFYGAYADEPVGAAGEDPVGAAVRSLRDQSASLAIFINRISWMWSFEQLKQAVGP